MHPFIHHTVSGRIRSDVYITACMHNKCHIRCLGNSVSCWLNSKPIYPEKVGLTSAFCTMGKFVLKWSKSRFVGKQYPNITQNKYLENVTNQKTIVMEKAVWASTLKQSGLKIARKDQNRRRVSVCQGHNKKKSGQKCGSKYGSK